MLSSVNSCFQSTACCRDFSFRVYNFSWNEWVGKTVFRIWVFQWRAGCILTDPWGYPVWKKCLWLMLYQNSHLDFPNFKHQQCRNSLPVVPFCIYFKDLLLPAAVYRSINLALPCQKRSCSFCNGVKWSKGCSKHIFLWERRVIHFGI